MPPLEKRKKIVKKRKAALNSIYITSLKHGIELFTIYPLVGTISKTVILWIVKIQGSSNLPEMSPLGQPALGSSTVPEMSPLVQPALGSSNVPERPPLVQAVLGSSNVPEMPPLVQVALGSSNVPEMSPLVQPALGSSNLPEMLHIGVSGDSG